MLLLLPVLFMRTLCRVITDSPDTNVSSCRQSSQLRQQQAAALFSAMLTTAMPNDKYTTRSK
eukprot:11270-Heterococcus_DN1.PRE.1